MSRPDRPPYAWLAGIVLAAMALRLTGLERVPPGLHHDEAHRGADAWFLWMTGADSHGQPWPFFLESYGPGDFTAALSTYLTIPFVAVLGRTPLAMRLPDALLGVATVLLLYAWIRRQIGPRESLLAAAILALDPWHIVLCRTAHEAGFAPFFLASAMLALNRTGLLPSAEADREPPNGRSMIWAWLGGFMLAMHAWIYPGTRLFTPLLIMAGLLIYGRRYLHWIKAGSGRRSIVLVAVGLVVGSAPIWLTAPEYLAARAKATMGIYAGGPASDIAAEVVKNWAGNFSPRYLFLQADEISRQPVPGVGLHLAALAPIAAIGLLLVIKRVRHDLFSRFVLTWLVLYPIPAALCIDWNPHPMRTVGGMLVFPILAAIGMNWLLQRNAGFAEPLVRATHSAQRRAWQTTLAIWLVLLAAAVNTAYFVRAYFVLFPQRAEREYQTTLIAAIRHAANELEPDARFFVTNSAEQPYTLAMLFEPYRGVAPLPLERRHIAEGPYRFHQVVRWGRWIFLPSQTDRYPDAAARFSEASAELLRLNAGPVYAIVRSSETIGGETLARFAGGPGSDRSMDCEIRRLEFATEPDAPTGTENSKPLQ